MQSNLKLLEKHRKKMWLLIGLIIFMFMYICIITFWITTVTSWERIEKENMWTKIERVNSIVNTTEVFIDRGNEDSQKIVDSILLNTDIVGSNGRILSKLDTFPPFDLEINEIAYFEGYKYLYIQVLDDGVTWDIITRSASQDILKLNLLFILFLIVLSPFLYWLLAFIGCRMMHRIYAPIKEIVINLEWFATNINHEFKTSLSEILSSLELSQVTKEYESGVSSAISSGRRLNSILDSLWILVRFVNADYRRQKINLISTLNESIDDYQKEIQEKEIKIVKRYDPHAQILKFVDNEPLLLCFTNILKNAIRYSHVWWKIEIFISRNKFIIKDYGIGIDEKNIEKIFERYFRENYTGSGSGIGLSLVKRISERYNWDIKMYSEKDKYTQVVFTF